MSTSRNNPDTPIYPNLSEPLRSIAIEVHGALHTLWTLHAHGPGYDKARWQKLSHAIDKLVRTASESCFTKDDVEAMCEMVRVAATTKLRAAAEPEAKDDGPPACGWCGGHHYREDCTADDRMTP